MRLTLGETRPRIGKILNICPTDLRVVEYVNAAIQRLLPKGKWVGTYQRYKVCLRSGCITWPACVETVEAYAIDAYPGTIRNEWFEFIANGPGPRSENDYTGRTLIDRGEACVFDDPRGSNQRIRLYADDARDAGAAVLVQYLNSYGEKVRTISGGLNVEGEWITLVAPPAYAVGSYDLFPNGIYAIQKPVTNGVVRAYSYNTSDLTQYPIGYYEPDETIPSYRRSFIPGFSYQLSCGSEFGCVTAMVKLKFKPAVNDNDLLLITSLPAIEDECMAVKLGEKPDTKEQAELFEASAVRRLQEQLDSWLGDGAVPVVRGENNETWGGGGVDNWT